MNEIKTEEIVLGGGCFWCIEAVFQRIAGVLECESGYAGGHVPNPTYQQVCSKNTGHAEVVKVKFEQSTIDLNKVLEVFWIAHDPTTQDRQGNDVGPQYRSVILFNSPEQELIANQSKEIAQSKFSNPIVTEIKALDCFYIAEQEHLNYFNDNQSAPYCSFVIMPKLQKLGLLK